jgi:hypothetical protein
LKKRQLALKKNFELAFLNHQLLSITIVSFGRRLRRSFL